MYVVSPYQPQSWMINAIPFNNIPTTKINLGRFPTPIHRFGVTNIFGSELQDSSDLAHTQLLSSLEFYIKRDDLTSFDLSGNKVRKLEFLLSDAKNRQHDSVITIGGIQSNHARATAIAARQIGIDPYLILRKPVTRDNDGNIVEEDVGLTGNLLFNRMIDAKISLVTPSTYAQIGSDNLLKLLEEQLQSEGKNPYLIPVGGSNSLGSFGYMECIQEIINQQESPFQHIVFACGSGGTAAGIALGIHLSQYNAQIHAIGVCDSPDYFYDHIEQVSKELEISPSLIGNVREWCNIYNGQGIGYAKSTTEELSYLINISISTGIILDPVYSGKALYHFMNHVIKQESSKFQMGDRILFIHTGGVVGLYDKSNEIIPLLPKGSTTRLKINIPK
eukprot:gene16816-23017_t